MKTIRLCPTCASVLPEDAPEGLCPQCLLQTDAATEAGGPGFKPILGPKPGGLFGGYRDMQLAPDTFRISFVGNGYVSKGRAQDYAMRRAAEITLRHGYRYFVVLDQQDSTNALGKPETVLLIGCAQEKEPGVFMFDAQFLQHSLREKSK